MNAVNDTFARVGAPYVQIPATPEKVWAGAKGNRRMISEQIKPRSS
jgi:hypothetical protein